MEGGGGGDTISTRTTTITYERATIAGVSSRWYVSSILTMDDEDELVVPPGKEDSTSLPAPSTFSRAKLQAAGLGTGSRTVHTLASPRRLGPLFRLKAERRDSLPLFSALFRDSSGKSGSARVLLSRESSPCRRGAAPGLTLIEAVRRGDNDVCEALLQWGADCNQGDKAWVTPLMVAAMEGRRSMVAMLLQSGALINCKDVKGESALCKAVERQQVWISISTHQDTDLG